MALDSFLELGSIKGESVADGFEDQIDVLAWSWGMSQSGSAHVGHGAGSGKANVQDLSFTHWVDKATPALMLACCKGTHFPEATLTMRKAGGDPLDYLVVTMKKVMVTSVSTGGSASEERLTENVSLNFGEFEVSYQPQDEKGAKKGGSVDVGFDIAKGVEV